MMAMYDYAKHLHGERVRSADRSRLLSALRAAPSRTPAPAPFDMADEWRVLWARSDVTGRAVTMVNAATGERRTGRDPADWDRALGDAVRQLGVGV